MRHAHWQRGNCEAVVLGLFCILVDVLVVLGGVSVCAGRWEYEGLCAPSRLHPPAMGVASRVLKAELAPQISVSQARSERNRVQRRPSRLPGPVHSVPGSGDQ